MRSGYEAICNATPGLLCCGAFADAEDIDFKIKRTQPDVVLMDIEMPGADGVTSTRYIVKHFPAIKILIQTVFDDDDKIFSAVCAGASGYILKSTTPAKMVESLEQVYEGGSPMTPSIASRVLKLFQQYAPAFKDPEENYVLSAREKEVLTLMIEGHNLPVIAGKLFISYETVRTHVKRIYKKLHVASASEAVVKALRERLV